MGGEPPPELLFEYLLRLGDDALVCGHRLSEWCSHAPTLEEDLALTNIALDCLGQGQYLLGVAAQTENKGRSADDLAFFREAVEFRNVLLAELPSAGDFALAIGRQFLFDSYRLSLYTALCSSRVPDLAAFAAKALKEVRYHFRHSSSWITRLGDGTAESRARIETALTALWPYTDELFGTDAVEVALSTSNVCPRRPDLRDGWDTEVNRVLKSASLRRPNTSPRIIGSGWAGKHTEHLGHMLAEMQITARSFPGASW